MEERTTDLSVNGRMILIDLGVMGSEGVDWIYMAQGRNRWRAVVNTIIKILVP